MHLRPAFWVLPAFAIACSSSSDNQTHGPVVDAGEDTATDNPPDGSPDGGSPGKDGGHKEGGGSDAKADGGGTPEASTKDGSKADASSCKGTVALAGGTSTVGFGATSVNGGAWNVTSLPTTSTASNPALVPFAGGFMAVFTAETVDTLQYSLYAKSSWSTAANADAASCTAAPTAFGDAALAAIGSTLHSVYLGTDYDFFHGTYTSGSWDCGSDPLTPSGGSQSFGNSAPSAASVGSSLIAAFDGTDGNLYTQSWTSGAWAAATQLIGASVGTSPVPNPPTLIALTGGTSDLMIVYENAGDTKLYSTTRASGTWSTPALTNMNAYSSEPVSVAPLPAGGAVLTFLGTDGNPYGMTFDPTASTPWSTPVAITTGSLPLPTPPTVAAGVCGVDAIAEVVQTDGVELVTLSAGTWSTPTLVSGTSGMSFATIATSP
jgi:hypothetical protein